MNPMMAAQRRRRSVTYSDEELPKLAVDEISLDEEPADEAEGAAISCGSLATKDVWLERGAAPAWAGTCCGGLSEGQPKVNQDACVVKTDVLGVPGQHLLAVFDGHGTHGEHFSRLAAQRVVAELRQVRQRRRRCRRWAASRRSASWALWPRLARRTRVRACARRRGRDGPRR